MEKVKKLVYYARVAISCFKVREVSEEQELNFLYIKVLIH